MFEYTKKNHFKFGYKESGWYRNRTLSNETFVCEYGRAERTMDFRNANIYAAKYIANIATDDISLMFSGGSDSEIAARAFIDAGVPFRAAVMRFGNHLNEHDITYAIKFCQKNNIKIDFYDLDIENFIRTSEYENIVKSYHASTERAASIWLAKQIPNFAVVGQGEPVITKIFGEWVFQEKEYIVCWNKYWIYNNISGIPGFHQFSPEQILSCLNDTMTQDLVNSSVDIWSNENIKHDFYKKHYPEFEPRLKYTGHEKLSKIKWAARRINAATYPYSFGEWQIPYRNAIEMFMPI